MKIKEEVIDNIIDNIIEMKLSGFDIICAHISTPEIVNEKEKICKIPIEIELKQRVVKQRVVEE